MTTFGKRIADLRKERKMTQDELAKLLKTSISVVGRYERDEMTPSIDVAKNIANHLQTTVGYLLGETENTNLFRDPAMLTRLSELEKMDSENKSHIITVVDSFIKVIKFKNITAL